MTPEQAFEKMRARFPFDNYLVGEHDAALDIAETLLKLAPAGARVLDMGSGPCDKTAVLSALGFQCAAIDDLNDPWHLEANNRRKIMDFAAQAGIDFRLAADGERFFPDNSFDVVMANAVIEHLSGSPREFLNCLVAAAKPGGLVLVTVPNAVNARKRLAVLRGKTNMPPFDEYYWTSGAWRGHVREYTRGDLVQLAGFLGLADVRITGQHYMLFNLPRPLRLPFRMATAILPGCRDCWKLLGRKPAGWKPRAGRSLL
jgi:SAM-dependent methyltransferase